MKKVTLMVMLILFTTIFVNAQKEHLVESIRHLDENTVATPWSRNLADRIKSERQSWHCGGSVSCITDNASSTTPNKILFSLETDGLIEVEQISSGGHVDVNSEISKIWN